MFLAHGHSDTERHTHFLTAALTQSVEGMLHLKIRENRKKLSSSLANRTFPRGHACSPEALDESYLLLTHMSDLKAKQMYEMQLQRDNTRDEVSLRLTGAV